jgi:predicted ATP-dependent endonuclease of OLD family
VLAYDLLFNVKPDALVLIDEPEISLHVAWQQQFLNDIARIAEVASLRFIIATHSPQIIHKWWAQAVALGPDAEDGRPTQ